MKTLTWGAALLSLIGIADTAYLSYTRATHGDLSCSILSGCNIVAASPESVLFGIVPLAYLGLAFYIAIFVLALIFLFSQTKAVLWLLVTATGLGFLSSIYFLYVQAYVIGAFCIYCLISAATATLLFALVILLVWRSFKRASEKVDQLDGERERQTGVEGVRRE